jgi:hypothetical protein
MSSDDRTRVAGGGTEEGPVEAPRVLGCEDTRKRFDGRLVLGSGRSTCKNEEETTDVPDRA